MGILKSVDFFLDCGGTIKKSKMISPILDEDPEGYGYNKCVWIAVAPANKSIILRFEKFNLTQVYGK